MVRTTKDILKAIRGSVHSLLHPLLRSRAHGRLRLSAPHSSVLFICLGNVCRSPYAEHSFRRLLPEPVRDHVSLASAGFIGPGRGSPEDALAAAAERSVDLSTHRSRVLTRGMAEGSDLIVVMEGGQRSAILRQFRSTGATVIVLGDLDPGRPRRRRILDPWGKSPQVFRGSFGRIDRCLAELIPYVGPRGTGR